VEAKQHVYQDEEFMMVMLSNQPALKRHTRGIWKRDELPEELKWLEQLSPLHYRLCIVELHAAVSQACLTEDWEPVANLIEDWWATAQIDAAPHLAKHLLASDLEYEDLDLVQVEN
jgi:hypothetical protein